MVYPVILLLMALLLLAIFYYQLVPTYSEMLPTDEWTGTAATMFTLTSAIFKTWYIVFPVLIGIGYVCFKSLPVLKGEFREKFWNENNKGQSMIHLCDNIFVTDSFKFFKDIK